jgi:hypothetical protein
MTIKLVQRSREVAHRWLLCYSDNPIDECISIFSIFMSYLYGLLQCKLSYLADTHGCFIKRTAGPLNRKAVQHIRTLFIDRNLGNFILMLSSIARIIVNFPRTSRTELVRSMPSRLSVPTKLLVHSPRVPRKTASSEHIAPRRA